ncbi:uncharacterized protein [Chelonus insularis]|uniref:uncharacterized protein n=1 Tax=Chelonus insularis TaxID=460826 RepID=UPI00158990E5|nr:uncharacterized protein LOC118068304 [Chelonus insularis]
MNYNSLLFIFIALLFSAVTIQCKANVIKKKNPIKSSDSVIGDMVKELIERSKNTDHVLNINLSNLFLLLFLKSVVFGANYIGNNNKNPRELEENILSDEEIALALGYLIGDTCLQRVACEAPETAKNYLGALDMIVQTMKLMSHTLNFDAKYDKTIAELRKAIEYGDMKQCPPEYTCKKENIKNFLQPGSLTRDFERW